MNVGTNLAIKCLIIQFVNCQSECMLAIGALEAAIINPSQSRGIRTTFPNFLHKCRFKCIDGLIRMVRICDLQ